MRLTWSASVGPATDPTASARLNHGWVGVTHEVCETKERGGASAGRARAAAAASPAMPKRAVAATASVQRAVLAQRVDTGRG